jgi:endogenous inhibitor of DNA gyrase (YacG/DUF329 family)
MQKVCSICSIEFEAKRKDTVYCSNKCKRTAEYNSRPFVPKICLNCEKNYETQNKKSLYCSTACSNIHSKTHDDVELTCKECNKSFVRKYIHRDKLFCSRSCATIHQNKIMYSNDEIRNKISETKKQQYASGEVVHPFLGKNLTPEHKQKLSHTRIANKLSSGENNPSYGKIGNKSPIYGIKRSKETKEKMSDIKSRQWLNGKYNGIDFNTFYKTGFFHSVKAKCDIWYRSGFEKCIYEKIENDQNIVTYLPEPFIIKYFYTSQGQNRNYLPDVMCFYQNAVVKLIEFKPEYKLLEQKNIDKFAAARKYCEEKGMTFEVWTEKSNPYLA